MNAKLKKLILILIVSFPLNLFSDYYIAVGGGGGAVIPISGGFLLSPLQIEPNDPVRNSKNGFGYGYYGKLLLGYVEITYSKMSLSWDSLRLSSGREIPTADMSLLRLQNISVGGRVPLYDSLFQIWLPLGGGFTIANDANAINNKNVYGADVFGGIEVGIKLAKNLRIEAGARYYLFLMKNPNDLNVQNITEDLKNSGLKADMIKSGKYPQQSLSINPGSFLSTFHSVIINFGMSFGF